MINLTVSNLPASTSFTNPGESHFPISSGNWTAFFHSVYISKMMIFYRPAILALAVMYFWFTSRQGVFGSIVHRSLFPTSILQITRPSFIAVEFHTPHAYLVTMKKSISIYPCQGITIMLQLLIRQTKGLLQLLILLGKGYNNVLLYSCNLEREGNAC